MKTTWERDDIVMSALKRQNIVASNVTMCDEDGEAAVAFDLVGLRGPRRQGPQNRDDAAELERRLYEIFPGMNDLNIRIEAVKHGWRWNRAVQFRMAWEQLDDMVDLQPAMEC